MIQFKKVRFLVLLCGAIYSTTAFPCGMSVFNNPLFISSILSSAAVSSPFYLSAEIVKGSQRILKKLTAPHSAAEQAQESTKEDRQIALENNVMLQTDIETYFSDGTVSRSLREALTQYQNMAIQAEKIKTVDEYSEQDWMKNLRQRLLEEKSILEEAQ